MKYRIEEKLVNRSLSFAPTGVFCAWYDKIHLFDVTLSEAESYIIKFYNYGENTLLTCKISFFWDILFVMIYVSQSFILTLRKMVQIS